MDIYIILLLIWGGLGLLFFFKVPADETAIDKQVVPVIQPAIDEEEVDGDEDAMANVTFFKKPLQTNQNFYHQLTKDLQKEFDQLFVLDHPKHLAKQLRYEVNGDNSVFFSTVFNVIYRYRKIISLGLLTAIYHELIRLADKEASTLTLLHEAMIRTTYYRRKDAAFLSKTAAVAHDDVILHRQVLKTKNTYIHSFVRLAIILEKQRDFKGALELIDDALNRQLDDRTKGGYDSRKIRVLAKMNKIKEQLS